MSTPQKLIGPKPNPKNRPESAQKTQTYSQKQKNPKRQKTKNLTK